MSLIKNPKMACVVLNTSIGELTFDAEGKAEATDEQIAALCTLPNYVALDDDGNEIVVETVDDDSEPQLKTDLGDPEVETPEAPKAEKDAGEVETVETDKGTEAEATDEQKAELEAMNVPQLKKYAKDNGIDLQGASKKDEILPILFGSLM